MTNNNPTIESFINGNYIISWKTTEGAYHREFGPSWKTKENAMWDLEGFQYLKIRLKLLS